MKRVIALMLVLAAVASACSTEGEAAVGSTVGSGFRREDAGTAPGSAPGADRGTRPDTSGSTGTAGVPDPMTIDAPGAPDGDLPVFLFLFTHTEDPFNHELSEERYTTLVPVVEEIAADNPDSHLTWTLMFQGSDARTVVERNPGTGVADLLWAAEGAGVVQFGYHGHHDPTYNNRPQNDFDGTSTWAELVAGMDEWISCRTDLVRGGCIEPGAGGLLAIESMMGGVALASGLFTFDYFETGAGVHAYRRYDPDRMVGFGIPDHGPVTSTGLWSEEVADLLTLLAPAWDTSPSLVWIDDIIRINGGSAPEDVAGINTMEGGRAAATTLAAIDRDRLQFFNAGIASKFSYAKTSPTVYGYSHPDAPELPDSEILDRAEIDANYAASQQAVQFLASDFVPSNPGSRFVDVDWIVDHVAPTEYFQIDRTQIDAMATWVLDHWDGAPPAWVYDGGDYYSIRDALVLFSMAVAEPDRTSFDLLYAYGPFDNAGSTGAATASRTDLSSAAVAIATAVTEAAEAPWELTPSNLLDSRYGGLTLAQVLYGLAALVAEPATPSVDFPATASAPGTLTLLEAMGCPTCSGTAWSLKPARIRLDG